MAACSENTHGEDGISSSSKRTAALIHIDWMIGSDQTDIDGVHADGCVVDGLLAFHREGMSLLQPERDFVSYTLGIYWGL